METEEVERGEVSFEPGHGIRLHYFADVMSELVREVLI